MGDTPHDWQPRVEINVDQLLIKSDGVKGYISQFWRCSRCLSDYHGTKPPDPFERVRGQIGALRDPDWMQELSCNEVIVKRIMVS